MMGTYDDILHWLQFRDRYRRKTRKLKKKLRKQGVVGLVYQGEPVLHTTTTMSTSGADLSCIACCDSPRNNVLFPCGHLVFCQDCAQQHCQHNLRCPICRGPINERRRIYL